MTEQAELEKWRILSRLGQQAEASKSFQEAEEFFLRALDVCKSIPEAKYFCLPICLLNLGDLYEQQKRFQEAENMFERLISIYSEIHGKESLSVSLSKQRLTDLKLREKESLASPAKN